MLCSNTFPSVQNNYPPLPAASLSTPSLDADETQVAVGYGTDLAARRRRAAVMSTPQGALSRLSEIVEVWRQRVLPAVVPRHAAAADRARGALSVAIASLAASVTAHGARPEFMVDADNRSIWLKRLQSGRSGARAACL